ncbi:MAG: YdbL family protein [Xanthomonadales bacterium]|nr:YdbL family protein [Gammaproteobacteria bacterium]MBT8053256.1 YdbL family protein [Gammaproteobacteria bacterium]NND56049.1 YdbL family protein [Xanthomonadales bacterium]NNK50296.1 YdbL family protein [Xanthomonadales bacterium]
MKQLNAVLIFAALILLGACVTINVYFPAAAAERAAEKFVGDVLGEPKEEGSLLNPLERQTGSAIYRIAGALDFLISDAQAQQAEIEINTPQINAIKARMSERQKLQLNSLFDAGAIGFGSDGLIIIRDRSAVSLSERRSLESVVADENRDRKAVYREIAVANGHPEWEQDIQETFGREWVRNARKGWYYQDSSGAWRQK